jgi:hypothetical protein
MFVPPFEIQDVYRKLVDLSNAHIVNVDWYEDVAVLGAEYNFIHQYQANLVKRIKKPGLDVKQAIFHRKKNHAQF